MTGAQIKTAMACFWRYEKQCPLVAFEADYRDVAAITLSGRLIETEVKTSLSDFRADSGKNKHGIFRNGNPSVWRFYFAVPYDIANQVAAECDTLYPYAGVFGVGGKLAGIYTSILPFPVVSYRKAKQLSQKKVSLSFAARLCRDQSATVCRLARLAYTDTANVLKKEEIAKAYFARWSSGATPDQYQDLYDDGAEFADKVLSILEAQS